MVEIHLARQPIYDRDLKVAAYDILYQGVPAPGDAASDPERTARKVILDSFMELGLDELVGERPAFIPFARSLVTAPTPLPLPVGRVVPTLGELGTIDEELLEGLRRLRGGGHRLALGRFHYRPELEPVLDLAGYVGIDLLGAHRSRLIEDVKALRGRGPVLLAERVESHEEFALCRDLGFELFQGHFLCQPRTYRQARSPGNRQAVVRLLAALQAPESDASELERAISQDVTLSYRLLRYVNSAFFGLRKQIDSIQRAIFYLGFNNVRAWASLIVLAGIDDKPSELVRIALQRARMCELLAKKLHAPLAEPAFTVGMFSVLDALLDLPMERALAPLPLAAEIEAALGRLEGELGALLRVVRAYERGDWQTVAELRLEPAAVRDAYLGALGWASQAGGYLQSA